MYVHYKKIMKHGETSPPLDAFSFHPSKVLLQKKGEQG
jgi:hypothetical protein